MSTTPGNSPAPERPCLHFVVLRHEGVADPHFDLLVEADPEQLLLAWRCPQWPPQGGLMLHRLPDHRRIYLSYEGPVTGGRGHVTRVAGGECRILEQSADRIRLALGNTTPPLDLTLMRQGQDRWLLSADAA